MAIAFEEENYAMVLNEVQNLTTQADYSIVNFECPVVTSDAEPILKCGPNLRCTSNGVKALKYAGFDCVTLAKTISMVLEKKESKKPFTCLIQKVLNMLVEADI